MAFKYELTCETGEKMYFSFPIISPNAEGYFYFNNSEQLTFVDDPNNMTLFGCYDFGNYNLPYTAFPLINTGFPTNLKLSTNPESVISDWGFKNDFTNKKWYASNGRYVVFTSGSNYCGIYDDKDNRLYYKQVLFPTSRVGMALIYGITNLEDIKTFKMKKIRIDFYRDQSTKLYCGGIDYISPDDQQFFQVLFENVEPYVEDNDPYKDGGTSSSGGGNGTFDNTSDSIDIPQVPQINAVNTNFISIFCPTLGQLQSLADYMWSDLFDINTWKKLFANPMDAILGLSIIPVSPSTTTSEVVVGNISTGVQMNKANVQYVNVDCGTLAIQEFWGAYLDYDPYTKIEIYLPYCGTHQLKADDVMGKSLQAVYHVDILSGACCCYLKCGDSVLYTFTGQCSVSLPISGNDFTSVLNGALSVANSVGSIITGGNPISNVTSAVGSVIGMKPNIEKTGSISGSSGLLAIQKPYIIVTRPNQCLPEKQNKYTGYPSYVTKKVGDLEGYTEFEKIRLDNVNCTTKEREEIKNILMGGVIL